MNKQQDTLLQQNDNFLKQAYTKAIVPCMLSILCGNITILADGILVGQRIGMDGLAAVNLCVPLSLVLCIVGSFLVSGTAICASTEIGKGDEKKAQSYYSTAVVSCVWVSVVITILGLLLLNPLVVFLGADEALYGMVYDYTAVLIIGALPKILLYIPFWYLRLDGRNKVVTWMMLIMGIGNVILDIVFLYVFDWGVAGAAWASIISTALACVVGFLALGSKNSAFHLSLFCLKDRASWKGIAVAGSPSALNNLAQTFRILVINTLLMKAGGSELVAVFSAVNCIAAFSQCVTDGVPQAGSAMLGVYNGEKDNQSSVLLLRREWKSGVLYAICFGVIAILGADVLSNLYGLEVSLRLPLICLSISLIPALWLSILSSYYNVSGHALLSNIIIILRVFVISCGCLYLLVEFEQNPWLFLIAGEVLSVGIWFVVVWINHKKDGKYSRYFLMDESIDKEGKVLNFSVEGNAENICDASARISGFCEENDMTMQDIIAISLAIEEIMTMILAENTEEEIVFDVRVFSLQGNNGIRIRYNGKDYNPFIAATKYTEDLYMGIRMIEKLANVITYQRTFGMHMISLLI